MNPFLSHENPETIATAFDTPMLKQYQEIKVHHQDAILFFRLGDFYEMFMDDAKTASEELNLTLTGRGKNENRVPMCGIPYHAAENYINKLVAKGYKVAICDQVEAATTAKLTKRAVVRIITPGTLTSSGSLDPETANYLLAVITQKSNIGIAIADASTGEFCLRTLRDRQELKWIIDHLKPSECLVPESDLTLKFSEIPIHRYAPLSQAESRALIEKQIGVHSLSGFGIPDDELAIPAAWAILDYLKYTQKTDLAQMRDLRPLKIEGIMRIDGPTQTNLELIKNLRSGGTEGTLFHLLKETKTSAGARLLKRMITEPSADLNIIENRLDAVASLIENPGPLDELRQSLAQHRDIERLITRITSQNQNPKDLVALKDSLISSLALAPITTALQGKLWDQFTQYLKALSKSESVTQYLIQLIDRAIVDDPPPVVRDGFVIKEGYSESLDTLELGFKSIRKWIQSLEQVEKEATGIKTLKVGFNKVFGYYIEVPASQNQAVPSHYIRKQTLANAERFITPELKEKEAILLNGDEKRKIIERQIYDSLIDLIKPHIAALQLLAKRLAQIDFLQAMASVSKKNRYVRPLIKAAESRELLIRNGRHPVLEQNASDPVVPNSIDMHPEKNRLIFITGPNMAGKSTVMRQIALTAIMAQMGCFVPAEGATISIVDQLFSRIGASDNLYAGQSTFMVEMLETANILYNASEKSLILLDEIGRGTATYDGLSLAWAISEYIHEKIGARTLFATHYHELTDLPETHPEMANFSMEITEVPESATIIFKYRLLPGAADKSYGIHVAKMAGLPEEVIQSATRRLNSYEEQEIKHMESF